MNVKVEITREELDRYIQFERIMRENPCYTKCNAVDRAACCGCPSQSEWNKRLEALHKTRSSN